MIERKLVALTFDDGPTIGITHDVLDVLEENNASASFFLIGQQITDDTRYLIKRAYDMGCSIENHSRTHSMMTQLTEQEIENEISYTTELIEDITGEKPEFFRPPYIVYDQKMYEHIDLAFICGYGCEDWVPTVTTEQRVERILHDIKPGNIVLLHDMVNNTQTVEAIRIIIPELKKQGYEFVNIRELFRQSGVKPQRNVTYMAVDEVRKDD